LGAVSFLTDISSEAIFSVFSVFFTVIVGAPASLLGVVEGFSDFPLRRWTISLAGFRINQGKGNKAL